MTNARGIWFVLALAGVGCASANGHNAGDDGGSAGTAGLAGTAGSAAGLGGASGSAGFASGGVGNVSGSAGFLSGGSAGSVAGSAGAFAGAGQGGSSGSGAGFGGTASAAGFGGLGGQGGGSGFGGAGTAGMSGGGSGGGGAGTAGSGNDGCSNTQAGGIAISEIAVYQAVKIPVMEDMQEVGDRNADVVAGRAALVRVFVQPGGGFTRREIAARLTLTNGAASKVYSEKLSPNGASSDSSGNSTFNFAVLAADITPDTEYSVELVECGTPSGTAMNARFPASGSTALEARETGVLKITIVPIAYAADGSNRVPDTDAATLAEYTEHMEKVYPVTEVQMTVRPGGPVTSDTNLSSGNGWQDTLYGLQYLRDDDGPDDDVYYYGLVNPGQDLGDYCGGGCTAGIAFVAESAGFSAARVGFGIGFTGSQQETRATFETMAHEVGHEHGRGHSPCGVQGDGPYPYQGGSIGSWGYDLITSELFDPGEITDIMGYCQNVWVSDYTYQAFVERVAELNGNFRIIQPPAAQYRTLLVDTALTTRWGFPHKRPLVPRGRPESASVFGADGKILTEVTVYRLETAHLGHSIMVPEPKPGWHSIQVKGSKPYPFSAAAIGSPLKPRP